VIYYVAFLLLLFVALSWFYGTRRLQDLRPYTLPIAFILKYLVGLAFFWLHTQTYGGGDLSHDGATYLLEGKCLNKVFYQSPEAFFRLLTGIGETRELVSKYLYMTNYWSSGDLTLINDYKNVIRAHAVIHFISWGNSFIHLGIFCLISLFATVNIYKGLKNRITLSNVTFFWIILLIPSTIFWTSSMLKEPFMFLGLSCFIRLLDPQIGRRKRVFWILIGIIFCLMYKPYVLLCCLIALLIFIGHRFIFRRKWWLTILVLPMVGFLFVSICKKPSHWVIHHLSRKQFDFVNVGRGGLHTLADTCFYYFQPHQYKHLQFSGDRVELISPSHAYIVRIGSIGKPKRVFLKPNGEKWHISYYTEGCQSFVEVTLISDSWIQLIKNIPQALENSVLRPYPTDNGSWLKYISFSETIFIFLFLITCFLYRKQLGQTEIDILLIFVSFALTLFLLIGWTTPVLGAIARYRFPAQLALVLCGLIMLNDKKLPWKKNHLPS
jgi:hypothetical protein